MKVKTKSESLPNVQGVRDRKVLVPVDFTHVSVRALEMAFLVAQHMPARIIVLEVLDPVQYMSKDDVRERFVQTINSKLRPDLHLARDWGRDVSSVTYQTIGRKTTIQKDVEHYALQADVDCMVLYTGSGDHRYMLSQSAAVSMFNHTKIPVFSFSDPYVPKVLKHILVPLDLSDHTLMKLEYTLHFFKSIKPVVHLLVVDTGFTKEEKQAADRILELAVKLVSSHGARAHGRMMVHHNVVNSVVAYALIVKADLVSNMFSMEDEFGDAREDKISTALIGCSPVPLYNFYVPPRL